MPNHLVAVAGVTYVVVDLPPSVSAPEMSIAEVIGYARLPCVSKPPPTVNHLLETGWVIPTQSQTLSPVDKVMIYGDIRKYINYQIYMATLAQDTEYATAWVEFGKLLIPEVADGKTA